MSIRYDKYGYPRDYCDLCDGMIVRAATRQHHRHGKIHLKCYVKLLEDTISWSYYNGMQEDEHGDIGVLAKLPERKDS